VTFDHDAQLAPVLEYSRHLVEKAPALKGQFGATVFEASSRSNSDTQTHHRDDGGSGIPVVPSIN